MARRHVGGRDRGVDRRGRRGRRRQPDARQPSIPVYKGDAFVPFSFEIEGDAVNFMQELGKLLQDGADQLTATAYTTGSAVRASPRASSRRWSGPRAPCR